MASSDDDDDGFEYNSNQDYVDIEHQIDIFEIRQCFKLRRQSKQRKKIPSYSIARGTHKSQHPLIKISGIRRPKTVAEAEKVFHSCLHLPRKGRGKMKVFDCDKQYRTKHDSTLPVASVCATRPTDFSTFRHHFYHAYHLEMKNLDKYQSHIEMTNISLAPISKTVQNDFMKRLNDGMSYYPHLVYRGTSQTNITPIIRTWNHSAYGSGIYCGDWPTLALSCSNTSNTLLACAALRWRTDDAVRRYYTSTSVISHVSEIIPLFLIHFQIVNQNVNYSDQTQPWIYERFVPIKSTMYAPNRPFIIWRKYLQKLLNCFKDQVSGTRPYRDRKHNRRKRRREDQYQMRVFETFG